MRIVPSVYGVVVSTCLALAAAGPAMGQAQDKSDKSHAPVKPPQVEKDTASEMGTAGVRLPEVTFQNVPFAEALNFIRDVDPNFQAVVTYEPGVEPGSPLIQDMRLKNVRADQVLRLIAQAYPQVEALWNEDEDTAVWVVRVKADPRKLRSGNDRGSASTSVHRLRDIIDWTTATDAGGAGKDESATARKKAIESVLSLIQASLETQGNHEGALLRLHEETETLLFKGTQEQYTIVSQALRSLQPPEEVLSKQTQGRIESLMRENRELRAQMDWQMWHGNPGAAGGFEGAPQSQPAKQPIPAPKQ